MNKKRPKRMFGIDEVEFQTLFDATSLARVIAAVKSPLQDEVVVSRMISEVNAAIYLTVNLNDLPNPSKSDVEQVQRLWERLKDKLLGLRSRADSPPLPPVEYAWHLEDWIIAQKARLARQTGGGPKKLPEVHSFYPRLLGLYAVAFGEEPRRSTSNDDGSASRFILSVVEQIRPKLDRLLEKQGVRRAEMGRTFWSPGSEDVHRKRLDIAFSLKRELPSNHGGADQPQTIPEWQYWAKSYEEFILTDPRQRK
ncbi:MAG: hypothetical protein JXQ91_09635 [Vannielia sp.]|uniref:hypothetical protein n=1 Tax=Vannielia sp. TaxID=2813045 RepID=UPI003B8CF42E